MQRSEIIPLFLAGHSLLAIAQRAGVSRERIRQVANICQLPKRREQSRQRARHRAKQEAAQQAERRAHRHQRVEEGRRRRIAYLSRANDLWKQGVSIRDIAKEYGIETNSLAWRMFNARNELGADWFPKRTLVPQNETNPLNKSRQRAAEPRPEKATRSGATPEPKPEEITSRYLTEADAQQHLEDSRQRGKRRALEQAIGPGIKRSTATSARMSRIAYLSQANAMWNQGSSIAAIAHAYGSNENWIAWVMFSARNELGPEWFPKRAQPQGQSGSPADGILS